MSSVSNLTLSSTTYFFKNIELMQPTENVVKENLYWALFTFVKRFII